MIGQDDACDSTARAIMRASSGLKNPDRPIATLLFSGPTGVGKTELTKVCVCVGGGGGWEALVPAGCAAQQQNGASWPGMPGCLHCRALVLPACLPACPALQPSI